MGERKKMPRIFSDRLTAVQYSLVLIKKGAFLLIIFIGLLSFSACGRVYFPIELKTISRSDRSEKQQDSNVVVIPMTNKNIKLANQLLKVRRRKKIEQDQATSQQNIKAQADANTQTTQAAAESEVQKQSALNQQKAELIQMEAELEVNKMKEEKELKKELMLYEFRLAKEMQKVQNEGLQNKEKYKEDRKDERTKIQASQQSELIEQRAGKQGKKVFESAGNDTMGSGFNMEMFEPR